MKFLKDVRKNKVLLLMALPTTVFYILFCYVPMLGTIIAFKNFKYSTGFLKSEWVGFKNFEFLFKTADAFLITRNTLLYNLMFILLGMVCSVSLAIMFDLLGKKRINGMNQTIILFPHFISWVVVSYFVNGFLSTDKGMLNKVIECFGGNGIQWYTNTKYWPVILVICYLWKSVGYNCIIYYSSISGFDTEYYEAAKIDGATWFHQVRYITLPLLKPIMIIMFILAVGSIFRSDFGLFYLVPRNSGPLYPVTSTIDTYVYNSLMTGTNIGMTTATGLYQSIVSFFFVLITNAIVKKISSEDAMF